MNASDFEGIERVLGHKIDPARKATIQDLYDIPPDLVADAKQLRSLTDGYRFLQYYTSSRLWQWLPEFMEDVLERGVKVKTWKRGGILFPLFAVKTLVTLNVEEILLPLAPRPDESWLQIAPNRRAWEIGEAATGAPALERPQLRYDSETSDRVRRVMLNGLEDLLDVADVLVATRRWIASRIAYHALKSGGIERFTESAALLDTEFPIQIKSNDACIATCGALREVWTMGSSDMDVPGFRGPSDWYR